MAQGQGPADDRPQPALVSRRQFRQSARRDVGRHRPPRREGTGGGREARHRRSARRRALPAGMEREFPLQKSWQQPLDTPDRVPAHRIYKGANGFLTGLIPQEEWRMRLRQNYYFNSIRDVDQQVVLMLDQLDRLGLTDKTIIVFTSDHGELLGSHGGLYGKGTTAYRQQNQVPMLIVHPEIKGGQRCVETHVASRLRADHRRHDRQTDGPCRRNHVADEGQDISRCCGSRSTPASRRARGGMLFCYSQLMVHDPGFTKDLYETLRDKSIARRTSSGRSNRSRSTGHSGSAFARSPTNDTSSAATSRSAASTRRRPWRSFAPTTTSSFTTWSTIPRRW